jgi:hypothetical protein
MRPLIFLSLFYSVFIVGCKDVRPQVSKSASASASPTPVVETTPSPLPMTAKEHWDEFKQIWDDSPYTPEDYAGMRKHLVVVASSKAPERHRAARVLKGLAKLEATMPTGDALKLVQKICEDLSGSEVGVLTDELKKSLHDPASLQDFQVKKCAPSGTTGSAVVLRATYRAKNTYGALTINEDQFLVVKSTDGLAKYKALVWVDQK